MQKWREKQIEPQSRNPTYAVQRAAVNLTKMSRPKTLPSMMKQETFQI